MDAAKTTTDTDFFFFFSFFQDRWNAFDFFIVVVSFVSVGMDVAEMVTGESAGASSLKLIRVLRVARLFRLIPKAKRLLKLFKVGLKEWADDVMY